MAHDDTPQPRPRPRFLNEIALAAPQGAAPAPRVAAVQIARWDGRNGLTWQTLDRESPIYWWALAGIRQAARTEED